MKTTIDLFFGDRSRDPSEQRFLAFLINELRQQNQSALIFVNFHAGKKKNQQIDFLVILRPELSTLHIEVKSYRWPIRTHAQGVWQQLLPSGWTDLDNQSNGFRQALDQKYSISDDLARVARNAGICREKFYKQFHSVVCFYPSLPLGSELKDWGDPRFVGYIEASDVLAFAKKLPSGPFKNADLWLAYANDMNLKISTAEDEETHPAIKEAREVLLLFKRLNKEMHASTNVIDVELSDGERNVLTSDLLPKLLDYRHHFIVGESGIGKTMLVHRLVDYGLNNGFLPIAISAKRFSGRLQDLLDLSVFPLSSRKFADLYRSAELLVTPVVLIVDAVNECPNSLKDALITSLLSLYQQKHLPIIFTSQVPIELPSPLAGETIRFVPFSSSIKRKIFR